MSTLGGGFLFCTVLMLQCEFIIHSTPWGLGVPIVMLAVAGVWRTDRYASRGWGFGGPIVMLAVARPSTWSTTSTAPREDSLYRIVNTYSVTKISFLLQHRFWAV